jgi:NAD(P)-dependent dehydrogenase (short-subunit alcohol dehydrogenase family)
MTERVALVMGAGDAIGSAIVRKFAARGLTVCAARRNGDKLVPLVSELQAAGHKAHAFSCDARDEDAVVQLFAGIERDIGELDAVIFNVGANVPMAILETDSRKFRKIWEMACFAGFLTGREAARYMSKRGRGTIIFTGATASVRGAAGFAAFASAKHGLRALAQSMARELGPKNIHVAHLVIDAAVDTLWINQNFPEAAVLKAKDGIVAPDDLADNYVMLHEQPRSAWTFELDVRPWIERW